MSPEIVVDWLAKNDQYARAIVNLAGIRTTAADSALPIRIECLWHDGFQPPLVYSIPLEEATLCWRGDSLHTALYRKTLGLLAETFKQIALPRKVVVFDGEINLVTKRLHFKKFTFGDSHVVPSTSLIMLTHSIDKLDKLTQILERFTKLSKKLKGIGYAGD